MYVKQVSMEEALRLASKGREIMVMAPGIEGENGWKDHMPDTLAGMLDGCMFFRDEPAMKAWDGTEEARVVAYGGEALLRGQIAGLPEAPANQPPDVWADSGKGKQ